MVGIKLSELEKEIATYVGIPYFINKPPISLPYKPENVLLGKGTAKEIALKTIELANLEKTKLTDFSSSQIYNFQKKHRIGIDCSGLVCHLLNFYFDINLKVRTTSANTLTSPPLSKKISLDQATTGDLIRTNQGHHVIFIIKKTNQTLLCVDSSLKGRGVRYREITINSPLLSEGIFRID